MPQMCITLIVATLALLCAFSTHGQPCNAPRVVDIYNGGTNALEIQIRGDVGFVTLARGLSIIDVSDPSNIAEIGIFHTTSELRDSFVEGNHAYLAAMHDGLLVIDISDLSNPVLVGSIQTVGVAMGVEVTHGDAFVTSITNSTRSRPGGFEVYDVSIPENPTFTSRIEEVGHLIDLQIVQSIALLAAGSEGVVAVDISNPAQLSVVGQVGQGESVIGVLYEDGVIYASNSVGGVLFISASDFASMSVFAHNDTSDQAWACSRLGNLLYVADDEGGVLVWDVSDFGNIQEVANVEHVHRSRAVDILATEQGFYVAQQSSNLRLYRLGSCQPDVNCDGFLTPTDFTAWINAFNNNLPECDQNIDESCTPTDFTAWIANFNAGC
ncbi:MAG: hypothetical protein Phyf2KO_00730 [Phycisphaerales bacterium]